MDTKKYKKEYYLKNKEYLDNKNKLYALEHKKELQEYRKNYYLKNKNRIIKNSQKRLSKMLYNGKLYKAWLNIKSRCYDKNNISYKRYGGRGIVVSKEWINDFNKFKKDMNNSFLKHISKYGSKNTTFDRINVNGNYCKENCRWATWEIQENNRRNNISYEDKDKPDLQM